MKEPKKGKLANPCTKTEIINRLAINESSNQIAKDYDVSGQRIRQIRKENQEKINEIASKLVQENLPDVYETVRNDVQTMKGISEKAKESVEKVTDREMQYKKDNNRTNENILRSVGIYPAQSPSLVIQNIYGDYNSQHVTISPSYQAFLDFQASNWKDKAIQADNTQHSDTEGDAIDEVK